MRFPYLLAFAFGRQQVPVFQVTRSLASMPAGRAGAIDPLQFSVIETERTQAI
ncbi:MAG TPA: hypothetical protein VHY35_11890 [Stellaceae bacterium]|jgi:hypothetical protein|nr:hypothetical protein [Stellaceae bacterium]